MRLEEYDDDDGRKVWLSNEEIGTLLDQVDEIEKEIALGLAARCGLRAKEIVEVAPRHLTSDMNGNRVRIEHGKGDKFREVPVPEILYQKMRVVAQTDDQPADRPFVDKSTRTIERWVQAAAEKCHKETDEYGWVYLRPHDLRRSWGTLLVYEEVDSGIIMSWGGWESWETFREHYLGAYSPEMEREEMEKVSWL